MTRNVVVTGIGMTTPLGGDAPSTWERALAGIPGTVSLGADWPEDQPAKIAALMIVNPVDVLDRVETRRMDRSEQCALVAAREAWADAGKPSIDPVRLGTVVASGIGGVNSLIQAYEIIRDKGATRVSPHMVTMIMPNGPAAMVGLEVGARAGVHTPVSACASGAEAISYAAKMIEGDRADIVVAGGTEACINIVTMAGFAAMRALSTRNDDPSTASRPYDLGRDGFVMGEGAGILILEEEEHAKARGAKIYGRYGGAGLTSDGHHIAQPDPDGTGAARAIREAIADADITAADIVHVNAHATSTAQGDYAESVAIRRALGGQADTALVSATKSMTGHLLGGAGAVESIFSILALRDRVAPPTINIVDFDESIELNVTSNGPVALPAGDIAALNNSFGFGGHDIALVFTSH
ncbi:MAG: beta-ketoacyl-[acyl-carrier-protein] synthase family protein [Candidatus Nanopelagicales bacterium]|nr:beta-ketoacyl-[acyl-carrier-protein] synthase family protein [Candidatus Nanopelagicales bacterium]